jgi:dihydrodipicolinate synthase/N-acetylneuraminate lyase
LGYHAALLGLAAMRGASEDELIQHCQTVARELPLIGFYLQTAVVGIALSRRFWTRFAGIDNVIAVKVAPFDRYKTLDVAFGVVAAGAEAALRFTPATTTISSPTSSPRCASARPSAR